MKLLQAIMFSLGLGAASLSYSGCSDESDAPQSPGISQVDSGDGGIIDSGDRDVPTHEDVHQSIDVEDVGTIEDIALDAQPDIHEFDYGIIDTGLLDVMGADVSDANLDAEIPEPDCILGETREFYTGPEGTLGVGVCSAGILTCLEVDGKLMYTLTHPEVMPTDEECDGSDNDCNNETDEGVLSTFYRDFDRDGFGSISDTVQACEAPNGYVADAGDCDDGNRNRNPAAVEICNRLDDDCDGATDLGCECVANEVNECGESNAGECQVGVQACDINGTWSDCMGFVGPVQELCNGLDDDCDGIADNGFNVNELCTVGFGECENQGVYICAELIGTICNAEEIEPTMELCNGLDDDCNRVVDNGYDLGVACVIGQGACLSEGVTVCSNDDLSTICNAEIIAPQQERCNGIDDDCDGEIDENFNAGDECLVGIGVCKREGSYACSENGLETACYAVPGDPSEELCNGLDDDCDGLVDEDFEIGELCVAGAGECSRSGQYICSEDGLETVCDAEAGEPGEEVCDGLDNNCNNETDEGFDVGEVCSAGIGACESEGVYVCSEDNLESICDAVAGEPVDEICGNGIDEDCDGGDGVCPLDKIAYMHGDIFTMNEDGTDKINLTEDQIGGGYPDWSPDGAQIMFSSGGDIYVMDANGDNQRSVIDSPGRQWASDWSPNGLEIAYTSDWNIWVADVNGNNQRHLTGGWGPSWSPDGVWITYQVESGGGIEVHKIKADGSEDPVRLTHDGGRDPRDPAWSPDGQYIAYRHGMNIWIMETDGNNNFQATNHPALDWHPSWAPDSRRLTFASERVGDREIYSIDIFNGEPAVRLTDNPGTDEDPDWSP